MSFYVIAFPSIQKPSCVTTMQSCAAGREEVNCPSLMVHRGEEFSISQRLFQLGPFKTNNKNNTSKKSLLVHQTQYTLCTLS